MILVDTSSWIHMLRPSGDPVVRSRVEAALTTGQACWCAPIQLELWNGARGTKERTVLRRFGHLLPDLPVDDVVWTTAFDLARRARARGVTVPAIDLVIAACAIRHGATLESSDSDFDLLASIHEPTNGPPSDT